MKFGYLLALSDKIVRDACLKSNRPNLNLVVHALSKYMGPRHLPRYIKLLNSRDNMDEWLSRRIKQELELPLSSRSPTRPGDDRRAEEWAYMYGYFERRLLKRKKNRKYLRYIYLLGDWLVSQPDLPKTYLLSLFRILLSLYRTENIPVRKEIIRLMGKVLRQPPNNMKLRHLRVIQATLVRGLEDESWEVKIFSAAALMSSNNKDVFNFLSGQLVDNLTSLQEEELFALFELMKRTPNPAVTSILLKLYSRHIAEGAYTVKTEDGNETHYELTPVNVWICEALAIHQSDLPVDALIYYLESDKIAEFDKVRIAESMMAIKGKINFPRIKKLAQSPKAWGRSLAAILIGERRKPAEIPLLALLMNDKVLITREYAIRAANKIKYYGSRTVIGSVKGGRINYFLEQEEENPILNRFILESRLMELSDADLFALVTEKTDDGDSHTLHAFLHYMAHYAEGRRLDSFYPLLHAKASFFQKRFAQIYLRKLKVPKPTIIFRMLKHDDFEVRLRAAVYIINYLGADWTPAGAETQLGGDLEGGAGSIRDDAKEQATGTKIRPTAGHRES